MVHPSYKAIDARMLERGLRFVRIQLSVVSASLLAACAACSGGVDAPAPPKRAAGGIGREQVMRGIRPTGRRADETADVLRRSSWMVVPAPMNAVPVVFVERVDGTDAERRMVVPSPGRGYAYLRIVVHCSSGGYSTRRSHAIPTDAWAPNPNALFALNGRATPPRLDLSRQIPEICSGGRDWSSVTSDVPGVMRIARKEEARLTVPPPPPPKA